MRKVLRKSRYGYALGVVLFLIGISVVIYAFWRVWLETGSFNEFLTAFWNEGGNFNWFVANSGLNAVS